MNADKPLEDEFSKLHTCFPVDTRIAIVGAGPSGLSTAYALVKLGYRNKTVLEKHHTVGGMCESVDIEGNMYDLGGQVLAVSSAPAIFHLAKEIGDEFEELDTHKLALIESSTGKFQDMKVADDYVSIIPLTLKLQEEAKNLGLIGIHAVSELSSDPTPEFLKSHGFKSVPKAVAYGYTTSGYGFIQDMPYAYIHEFIRTSMAGKIRHFKGGYTSVGDGVMFYFYGSKGGDFALVSDNDLQINAHFIGSRPVNRKRDSHALNLAAKKISHWDDSVDTLIVRYDRNTIDLPTNRDAEWHTDDGIREIVVERTDDTNNVRVMVTGLVEMYVKVTPIGNEENKAHNYQLPSDDA